MKNFRNIWRNSKTSDYISREAAVKIAEKYGLANGSALGRHTGLADCIAIEIEGLPAADVEPVRRGNWNIRLADEMTLCLECSVCGRRVDNIDLHYLLEAGEYGEACRKYPYCHCGAKMDLEDENNGREA